MRKKRASEIFHEVDPNLRVVDGGVRRKRRSTIEDWEKASGGTCSVCNQETLRIIDGMCPQCANTADIDRVEKLGRESEKRYYVEQIMTGKMTLTEMKKLRH